MKFTDELTRDEDRQVAESLLRAINDRPADWDFDEHLAIDKKSGVEIWICNGISFVKIWNPTRAKLRLASKFKIWFALKRIYKARPRSGRKFRAIMDALDVRTG